MASVELASAYVSVIPEVRGISGQLSRQLKPAQGIATAAGRSMGSRMGSAIKSTLKTAAVGVGITAGAAIGASLVGGFRSAIAQQDAKKILSGLYGSAKGATAVMKDLRKVAGNSPIEYSAYLKAAQGLAYAGVKGDDAAKSLKNVGLAITAVGGTSEDMQGATDAVLKMVNAGKVTLDTVQQLSNTGVPIISGLAEHFGVSIDKVNKMASEGQIGLSDVMSVMRKGTGDTFQSMITAGKKASKSFGNQWKIAKDRVFTAVGKVMLPLMEKLAPVIGKAGTAVAGFATKVGKWLNGLDFSSWDGFIKSLKLGSAFNSIMESLTTLKPAFRQFIDMLPALGAASGKLVSAGLHLLVEGLKFLAKHVDTIIKYMPLLVAAFVAWRLAQRGVMAAQAASVPMMLIANVLRLKAARAELQLAAAQTRNTIATHANTTAQRAGIAARAKAAIATGVQKAKLVATTVATKAATVAQRALNAVMRMNPIGLIITAITALVAAIVWLYNNNKTAKRIIDAAWKGIKNAVKWAWEKVIRPAFKAIWGFVKKYLIPVIEWLWNKVVKPSFKKIGAAIKWAWVNVIKPAFKAIWGFIKNDLIPWFQKLWHKVRIVWYNIRKNIKRVWVEYIKPVFDTLKDAVGKIPGAFEKARDAIGRAWDKLKSIAKKPIKFVVNRVINDGLIGTLNKIPGVDIPEIKLPKGFAKGGLAKGWSLVGEEGPELVNFTNPGRVYTAAQTNAALKHTEDGNAAVTNRIAGGGGGFGAIWGPFQNAIRAAGRLFVGTGAGPAWNIRGAASMWDQLAGLRVRAGRGYPQATTGLGPLGSILAWATGSGNITFNTQGIAPGLSPVMKTATAAHEIGHVLGLPHTNAASIMQPVMGKYMHPTAFDKRRLESLYGPGSAKPGEGGGGFFSWIGGMIADLADTVLDKIKGVFPKAGFFIDVAAGVAKEAISTIGANLGDLIGLGGDSKNAAVYDSGGVINPGRTLVENRGKPEALLNPRQWNTAHRAIDAVERQQHMTVFVQNPWTGEYMEARMADTAVRATGQQMDAADDRLRWGGKYTGALV